MARSDLYSTCSIDPAMVIVFKPSHILSADMVNEMHGSLNTREATVQSVIQGPLVLIVVVRMCSTQGYRTTGHTGCATSSQQHAQKCQTS